jgi:hypothetical protein
MPNVARADAAVDEIIGRYNVSLGKARTFCTALPEQINKVKLMAGISVGAGALGTIGGGTAVVTGVIKWTNDKKIDETVDPAKIRARAEELQAKSNAKTITPQESQELVVLTKHIQDNKGKFPQVEKDLKAAKNSSITMGNVRTIGAAVSAVGGGVGAATSFGGLKTLDDLIANMNACDSYVQEINRQKMELTFAAPDDPTIARMDAIIKNCDGMSSKNIASVKSKLKISGIFSAVGAAAGVAGSITSAVAVSKEKGGASATASGKNGTKCLNMAANISSGVATVGNLGGAILSGTVLAGLNKNSGIAEACAGSF